MRGATLVTDEDFKGVTSGRWVPQPPSESHKVLSFDFISVKCNMTAQQVGHDTSTPDGYSATGVTLQQHPWEADGIRGDFRITYFCHYVEAVGVNPLRAAYNPMRP